jgi:hypothetical protein
MAAPTTTAYASSTGWTRTRACPTMVDTTARYMGLRTYRYRPPTTSRWVGATGAGVPEPSATKRTNACTSTTTPAASSTAPATRSGTQAQDGCGWRTRQPVSHQGTRPATTPGASTKNTTLTAAAAGLRMVSSSSQDAGPTWRPRRHDVGDSGQGRRDCDGVRRMQVRGRRSPPTRVSLIDRALAAAR